MNNVVQIILEFLKSIEYDGTIETYENNYSFQTNKSSIEVSFDKYSYEISVFYKLNNSDVRYEIGLFLNCVNKTININTPIFSSDLTYIAKELTKIAVQINLHIDLLFNVNNDSKLILQNYEILKIKLLENQKLKKLKEDILIAEQEKKWEQLIYNLEEKNIKFGLSNIERKKLILIKSFLNRNKRGK